MRGYAADRLNSCALPKIEPGVQEMPVFYSPLAPFHFKQFYEACGDKVRIWGKCEVTGKGFELMMPAASFHAFLQGVKSSFEALNGVPKEERDFVLRGISPQGSRIIPRYNC